MENQKIPHLKKSTDTYRLVIPIEVERKIRHLCTRIPDVEWSGTLFYTYTGTFEDGTLEIKCVDIFPMDIGSRTYTEFDMSPDVIAYMTDRPELLDCQIGLAHSHNSMATFFSGTDTNTLAQEGNDRNHFVSLIVNNEGAYTAAITRKLIIKNEINSNYTYNTFGDEERSGTHKYTEETVSIVYNMLDIVKEGNEAYSFQDIDDRLDAIRKAKKDDYFKNSFPPSVPYTPSKDPFDRFPRQGTLFDEDRFIYNGTADKTEEDIVIDDAVVKTTVLQLITGSIAIADSSRIDPTKWSGQMVPLFDKRFKGDIHLFSLWIETLSEFILTSFIPKKYENCEDAYVSTLSTSVCEVLEKLPKNKYIDTIKEILFIWMK